MAKYRKRPVVVDTIEAMQFTTNNEAGSPQMDSIVNWINQGRYSVGAWHNGTDIYIAAIKGWTLATVGDWIVKDANGEFCPWNSDLFAATYEEVTE